MAYPNTLGALARPRMKGFQRMPGVADAGGESMSGALNTSPTPTYTGPMLDGSGPRAFVGKEPRPRAMFERGGYGNSPTPDLLPAGMLDWFTNADDASRTAMFGDVSAPIKNQLAARYGAGAGMTANDVLNRYAGGGDITGSTYKPGQFGGDASTTARWMTYRQPGAASPVQAGGGGGGASTTAAGAPGATGTAGLGSPGYGVNVADFLDPSMRFQMGEGIRALENSAAARGSLMSGGTLRDLLRYSQGLASTDFGNAFGRAANARDFTYGVDAGDRAFDYAAQRDDRNFNYGTLRDLANMGLSSASQSSNSGNALAGILASILANRGQIEGTGAIGGSNAINGSISQILNMLLTNNALQNIGGR